MFQTIPGKNLPFATQRAYLVFSFMTAPSKKYIIAEQKQDTGCSEGKQGKPLVFS